VLRRSGSASRPPSNYRLVSTGRWYTVWQRDPGAAPVQHAALGTPLLPAAAAPCATVQSLAAAGSRLAFVDRPALPILFPGRATHPASWKQDPSDPTSIVPSGAGAVEGTVEVPAPGRYLVWVQGSFSRGFTVFVSGRRVGSVRNALNPRGEFAPAGALRLSPGRQTIRLVRPGGSLAPGNGAAELLGPIELQPATDSMAVQTLPSSRWRELGGKQLDWVEALR
jgi:hypothetical protein